MIARNVVVLFAVLAFSLPAYSQGSDCRSAYLWSLGGGCCTLMEGPGNDPRWQQIIRNAENQGGGPVVSCTYTPVINPETGDGWYIGMCVGPTVYDCNSALPPPPPKSGSETSGASCSSTPLTCGRPINLATGNTYIRQPDILLPGLSGGLSLTRTWNSVWPATQMIMSVGLFGTNWKSTYEERVFLGNDGAVKYSRSTGDFWSFQIASLNGGPNAYHVVAPANVHAVMTYNTTAWTLTFPSGETRTFDGTTGALTSIIDRNGNTTLLTYDSSNRLVTVTDASSRHLYFTYANSSNSYLVTGVSSDVAPSWAYSYDSENRLTQVTKPDQTTINFTYNTQSLITAVTDSQGKILESHTYDNSARGLTSSQANGVEAVTVAYPQ